MPKGLHVVCAAKLHANQLERHLELLERVDEIERITVVRHAPLSERLSKIRNLTFKNGSRLGNALRMYRCIRSLIREEKVDWVIGFNPVPWGAIAYWATLGTSVRSCISFIGMDFLQVQRIWGAPFLNAARHASKVTVTGTQMATTLEQLGLRESKLSVLPHSVDTERFRPRQTDESTVQGRAKGKFDIIAIGQLIQRKRMDTLIEAVALCKAKGIVVTLAILGKGPLKEELIQQAQVLGVLHLVDFLGYQDNVEEIVAQARLFCLASEWEGVPFALMEAMSAGVVPIVTPVGTISDWVRDGENGLLTPIGDADALADRLIKLTTDEEKYQSLRNQLLLERERLSFTTGTKVWRDILELSTSSV